MSCLRPASRYVHRLARLKAFFLLLAWLAASFGVPPSTAEAAPPPIQDYVSLESPKAPGGSVWTLAQAPSDPDVLYNQVQGSDGYGFFRSLDGGATWQPRYLFSYWGARYTGLAVDRADPAVLYAFGDANYYAMRSLDGGASWTPLGFTAEMFAAASPQRLYAGSGKGSCSPSYAKNYSFFYSNDGGQTWNSTALGCLSGVRALAVLPSQPELVYLIVHRPGQSTSTLLKSSDAGQTWSEVTLPFYVDRSVDLLIDPVHPDRLYTTGVYGIYTSLDGGGSWQMISTPHSWPPLHLALSGGRLYVIEETTDRTPLFHSADGGATWWASTNLLPAGARALLADPADPQRVWAGLVSFGMYYSEDGGGSWSEQNDGILSDTTLRSLSVSPSDPDVIYAAVQSPYDSIYRSDDGGQTWGPRLPGFETITSRSSPTFRSLAAASPAFGSFDEPALEIRKVQVHPQNSNIAWAVTSYGVYETINGQDWQLQMYRMDAADLSVSAVDPDHAVAVLRDEMGRLNLGHRYCDPESCRWSDGDLVYGTALVSLDAIALDPQQGNRILVAGKIYALDVKKVGIYQHLGSGTNWQLLGQIDENATPLGLVISPQNPRFMLAYLKIENTTPRLYCSRDGGAAWEDCTPEDTAPVVTPVFDELGTAYLGTVDGVYRRLATQATWEPFWLNGLLMRRIYALAYGPGPTPYLLGATERVLRRLDLSPFHRNWLPTVRNASP